MIVALVAAHQSARHIVHKTQAELTAEYNQQMDTLESVVLSTSFLDSTSGHNFDLERLVSVISQFKYGMDVTQISFRDLSDAAAYNQEITIPLEAPLFFSRWCGLEIINLNRPLIVDGVYHGLLSLSMSPNRIINHAWEHYLYLVRLIGLSLTIVLLGIWVVLRAGLRPLLALAHASKAISQGDLSARVEIAGSPELRTVLLTFNQMASSFQATLDALQKSELRSRIILQTAMDGFWIVDPSGHLLEVNDAYCTMSGYSRDELLTMTIPQLEAVESSVEVAARIRSILAGGYACFETMHRRKDGGLLHLEVSTQRHAGSDRDAFVAFLRDTTKRKQAEEALRESEAINRTILESLSQKIFMKDRNSVFLFVNKPYADSFGVSPEEFVGKDDFAFFPADLASKYRADDRQVMESGQIKEIEEAYTAQGKDRVAHTIKVPVRNEAGEVTALLGSFEDITDRKQAEKEREKLQAQLNQAQKMESIGILAGGIAHDFNNILAAILGYTELALDDAPPGSLVAKDLDKVLTSAHRAKDLVKQILAFSRQSAVDRIPIKIQPLVKESLKMLRASIPSTISITEDIHPQSGTVLADPTQIHQIVMNLCTNAYHAMEESGGVLSVVVRSATIDSSTVFDGQRLTAGDYVELTVSDTGAGMGPDIIDKIFDPYFTTKGIGKGTGMGLSITHGIIKSYGGAITVESTLGLGTTFRVYLPLIEDAGAKEFAGAAEAPRGKGQILFVDDEELLMEMGHDMLERLGYTVTSRRSSFEALETFMNDPQKFDLVITDQTMLGMTGIDLARRMLQIRPDIPIILCTGYSNLVSEESAKVVGIREFALKPLTKSSIAQLVEKILKEK